MFTTYSHLKAEDKYRRDVLRDQYQTKNEAGIAKTVAALVVAGAIVLAACGIPSEADSGAVSSVTGTRSFLADPGPVWSPNLSVLIPAAEFGGMAAPGWQPNLDAITTVRPQVETNTIRDTEPPGPPNYGRLETALGAAPAHGPR